MGSEMKRTEILTSRWRIVSVWRSYFALVVSAAIVGGNVEDNTFKWANREEMRAEWPQWQSEAFNVRCTGGIFGDDYTVLSSHEFIKRIAALQGIDLSGTLLFSGCCAKRPVMSTSILQLIC